MEDLVTELLVKDVYVYDPFNGVNGDKMDVAIRNGKIVRSVNAKRERVINMSDMTAILGGIDVYAHVCSSKVNTSKD